MIICLRNANVVIVTKDQDERLSQLADLFVSGKIDEEQHDARAREVCPSLIQGRNVLHRYQMLGSATGRLERSEPSFQEIPRKSR